MRGGRQDIGLASGCGTGATIHEIGHAFGLWHEQSGEDRDRFVKINW
jgi:astacin